MAKCEMATAFLLLCLCGVSFGLPSRNWDGNYSNKTARATFANPVLDEVSPDPAVIKHNGFYYLTLCLQSKIHILKSPILSNFRNAERRIIYVAPPNRGNLWAAEMHFIQNNLYIYFTMDDLQGDQNHRMYAIKADNPNDPLGNWSAEKRVQAHEEKYAIDGTVMQYNGRLYFIWTGNPDTGPASMGLFIAPMDDPMTVTAPRILLRRPKSEWEMHGFPVNEGPFIVENEGRTFLIFSGSSTFTPDYCLSMIGIDFNKDPLVPSNWWDDIDKCLFHRNDAEGVFGTGHATFVRSKDDRELWMMYHAVSDVNDLGVYRTARLQKIEWMPDKSPKFPAAIGVGKPLQAPSGE